MPNPNADLDLKLVNDAVQVLRDHFDTVQVFTTRYEGSDTGTINVAVGSGNWFARTGQVAEWLSKEREDALEDVRSSRRDDGGSD